MGGEACRHDWHWRCPDARYSLASLTAGARAGRRASLRGMGPRSGGRRQVAAAAARQDSSQYRAGAPPTLA